jgi:hypothetical protein
MKNEREENQPKIDYDLANEPIVLSKGLLDLLLKQEHSTDLIGLYCFYYYTAKWQKTNQVRATTNYTAKGLGWSAQKVRNNKNTLLALELIENIRMQDEQGRVSGYYIKVKFLWGKEAVEKLEKSVGTLTGPGQNQPNDFPESGKSQSLVNREGNALSTNTINALNNNNKNALNKSSTRARGQSQNHPTKETADADNGKDNTTPLKTDSLDSFKLKKPSSPKVVKVGVQDSGIERFDRSIRGDKTTHTVYSNYQQYRREKGSPLEDMTPTGFATWVVHVEELCHLDPIKFKELLRYNMSHNWTGLFKPKEEYPNKHGNGNGRQVGGPCNIVCTPEEAKKYHKIDQDLSGTY